jgi:hypothetical protein
VLSPIGDFDFGYITAACFRASKAQKAKERDAAGKRRYEAQKPQVCRQKPVGTT